MPAPAVYVLAIVGTIAAGIAFKEFVYEPHIAPKIEQWAEEFLARRQARRRQRAGAVPVPVPQRRDTTVSGINKRSDSADEGNETRQSIELENLIAREVREWRSKVNTSQNTGLRHRSNAGYQGSQHSLGESTISHKNPFSPASPNHVLFDPSAPPTPSSTLPSIDDSPLPKVRILHETSSQTTLRSPPPPPSPGHLPTPSASNNTYSPLPPRAPLSPSAIPSLSQSYPFELDHEHGLELLSAPSSRPDTPFSSFSHPSPAQGGTAASSSNYYSFSSPNGTSPHLISSPLDRPASRSLSDLDFLSDFEPDAMSPRSSASGISFDEPHFEDGAGSEVSGSSWASAGPHSRPGA